MPFRIIVERYCDHPALPCKVIDLAPGTIFKSESLYNEWWLRLYGSGGQCMSLGDFSTTNGKGYANKPHPFAEYAVSEVYGKLMQVQLLP